MAAATAAAAAALVAKKKKEELDHKNKLKAAYQRQQRYEKLEIKQATLECLFSYVSSALNPNDLLSVCCRLFQ